MRLTRWWLVLMLSAGGTGCGDVAGDTGSAARSAAELPIVEPTQHTPALPRYDDAPRTPDADDPAIWIHPRDPARSLVIAALKEAGLGVYDLSGRLVQTVLPAFRPPVDAADPPVPGEMPDAGTAACPDSSTSAAMKGLLQTRAVARMRGYYQAANRKRRMRDRDG